MFVGSRTGLESLGKRALTSEGNQTMIRRLQDSHHVHYSDGTLRAPSTFHESAEVQSKRTDRGVAFW